MSLVLSLILIPLITGIVCLPLRRLPSVCRIFSLVVFGAVLALCVYLCMQGPFRCSHGDIPLFAADGLAKLICLWCGLFGFVIGLYSIGFFGSWERSNIYYGFLLMTEGAALAAALADNLLLLLCAWGFLGITLYILINLAGGQAAGVAKKTLIIVGGSDALMILGVVIVYFLAGEEAHPFSLGLSGYSIPFRGAAAVIAYLCLAAAAFAKAGAMPLHSWVPDCAEKAPLPVTAYLPASLDKLLGIYLLARISLSVFVMNDAMQLILMVVGAVTVVGAVMMAMVQHNLKRLLGYHAVSQVGYMVLGIGTGVPIGVAGGLFHMINHCLYKACLFLTGGSVEKKAGTAELDELGGLARAMPISFLCCLVAALAISGIPPLNGFASKWMVYQGLIEMGKAGGRLWVLWLLAAMFGSALTLASFVKLLHAVFLGQRSESLLRRGNTIGEVGPSMWVPMAVLAGLCLIFGVFAIGLPVRLLIAPAIGQPLDFLGLWHPAVATWLVLIGIAVGIVIYRLSVTSPSRESEAFVGGEEIVPEMTVSGVDFYQTIKEMGFFKGIYREAERKAFDIYDQGRDLVLHVTGLLRDLHGGLLPVYLGWCLAGILILFLVLMR
jgi:formate hydrogenlyase subunit 3/multisubunit Na+/H+ antiporter MnhD subunit